MSGFFFASEKGGIKMICRDKIKYVPCNSLKLILTFTFFLFFFASTDLIAATHTVGVGQAYATITEAIAAATAGDTIDVYGTITLEGDGQSSATSGVDINKDLIIQGQGPTSTIVQADATQGTATRRVFTVPAGITVTLKDMTIRYGNCAVAGAIRNEGALLTIENCVISDNNGTAHVGAIYHKNSTLVLSSSEIINNTAPGMIGAIYNNASEGTSSLALTDCTISNNTGGSLAGGIDNVAVAGGTFTLTLEGCTFSGNQANGNTSSDAGAIRAYLIGGAINTGTLNATNCTFFENTARNKGGAIALFDDSESGTLAVNLLNCTIVGNRADSNDDGVFRDYVTNYPNGLGGGIFIGSTLIDPATLFDINITNCLIADNISGSSSVDSDLCCAVEVRPQPLTVDMNYSILEVWDATRITLNGTNNLTGQQASLNVAGALADNGGSTQTLALLAGSVAINAGTDTGAPATDQRGYDRISPCDIGAYEYQPTYPVTYNGNGNTSGTVPTDQTKTYGVDLTLATNTGSLGRTGYTFNGWNTATDGSGTHYDEGATYTDNGPLTLYAEWTANTYPVTYNGNGNTSGTVPADQTKIYDVALTLATNTGSLARTGYTFNGWNTATDGNGTHYDEGATYTDNGPLTLYAEWTANTYPVTYNGNGNTSGTVPADQTKIYDVALTLATNTGSLARTGYTFNGWNTATDGNGTHYDEGATYTDNAALTLYAEWTAAIPAAIPTLSEWGMIIFALLMAVTAIVFMRRRKEMRA